MSSSDSDSSVDEFNPFNRKRRFENNDKETSPSSRFKFMSFQSGATLEPETLDAPMATSKGINEQEASDDEDERPTMGMGGMGGMGAMNSFFSQAMGRQPMGSEGEDDDGIGSDDEDGRGDINGEEYSTTPTIQFKTSKSSGLSNNYANNHNSHPHQAHVKSYGIGAKLLGKMGYVPGKGLGSEGKGIVEPIQQKLRPTKLGLGGIDEKTDQAKRSSKKQEKELNENAASTLKVTRTTSKDLFRIILELEEEGLTIPNGFRLIVEKSKLNADDPVVDKTNNELQTFQRQWRTVKSREEYTHYEINQLKKESDKLTDNISDIRAAVEVIEKLKENMVETTPFISNSIAELLDKLQFEFIAQLDSLHLDQIAIAVIKPSFQLFLDSWNPLDAPIEFRDYFLRWKILLRIQKSPDNDDPKLMNNFILSSTLAKRKVKTSHFESLIYNLWFPKIKSTLLNQWDVSHPASAILLLEEWDQLIPQFVKHAILYEIILPKFKQSINEWSPSSPPLHLSIFPWLPYLNTNENIIIQIISEITLKFIDLIKNWNKSSIIPSDEFISWKQLIGEDEMNEILQTNLIPKLKLFLKKEFKINPSNQDLSSLDIVVNKWGSVVPLTTTATLLESEFFPKWLDILHTWLTDSNAKLEDISSWYQAWNKWFSQSIKETLVVQEGFRKGLDLINDALDLNPNQRHKLEHPSRTTSRTTSPSPSITTNQPYKKLPIISSIPAPGSISSEYKPKSTFRNVVEELCLENDLFLIPQHKSHPTAGRLLYKISTNPSGQSGVLCYFDEDVLWIQPKQSTSTTYEPISLDQLSDYI